MRQHRTIIAAAALLLLVSSGAARAVEARCGPDAEPPVPDRRWCSFAYEPGTFYEVPLTMAGIVRVFMDPDDDVHLGGALNPEPKAISVSTLPGHNSVFLKPLETYAIGRTFVVPVFSVDRRTGETREYDLHVTVRPEEMDGATGPTRFRFTYPGREEAKREWERKEAERRRREAKAAADAERARALGPPEQRRAEAILEVAHHYGPRSRAWKQLVEPGSPGAAMLEEMRDAGLRVAVGDMLTVLEIPEGTGGVAVFAWDHDGKEMSTSPIPKGGGTFVLPRPARRLTFRRGDAVFCLLAQEAVPASARPRTGTIDPRVTVRPRQVRQAAAGP